ncbi:PilZ domain-containing protein [Vulcaniibacterium gelatinicum]|uniref:PilZ domain-containing protein n=1 Tax=Vulcaniibacterium gelatinicum TaxID=2598725 RepID=UPI0011CC3F7F|nr:PilZ domain-containing protein [Vulcaniibacterium gelatinicum]
MINEFRRARRRKVSDTVLVVDTMTDSVVGRLGNLSETGMLLMASMPLVDDALYQFRFNLTDARGRETTFEVGAHLLWQDSASASGQSWTGFRFITVPDEQMQQLRHWIEAPGGQFE